MSAACVGHSADFLDRAIGFGLDLVQIPHPVAANTCRLAVAFGKEALGDLPPFRDHAVVDLRPHAFIVVYPLEADVEQLDPEDAHLFRGRLENLLLDKRAPLLDGNQRADVLARSSSVRSVSQAVSDPWSCE
jgi:hypothetical protein